MLQSSQIRERVQYHAVILCSKLILIQVLQSFHLHKLHIVVASS